MIAFSHHFGPPAAGDLPASIPATATHGSPVPDQPGSAVPDRPETGPSDPPGDIEGLGDEIARLAAHIHAATYQLLVLIRRFDEEEGWAGGFRSCAHWLSWRTGIAPGPARERVRVANALDRLPLISDAMANGEMSFSKVRALTRKATPENEAALLDVARHATAARTEELIQCWSRVDRLEEARNEKLRHQSRFLQLNPDQDGSYSIRGRLDPEVGALLEMALEWAAEELYRTRESATTFGQRQADALGLVAERALPASSDEGGLRSSLPQSRSHLFQVVVHVDAADLEAGRAPADEESTLPEAGASGKPDSRKCVPAGTPGTGCDHRSPASAETGENVPAHIVTRRTTIPCAHETARRLACDGSVVLMAHGEEGGVLDVGRKRRTIPPAIRRALNYRDKGCRFPGCGCRFADAHHIVHWADGGETKRDNLILVCKRHHRALHEEGYGVEVVACAGVTGESVIGPEITFRFLSPDGRVIPEVPTSPPVPADPVASMVRKHAEEGIEPHEWTATPQWHGEVLDYGLAIDMFRGTFPQERPDSAELTPTPD